MEYLHYIGMLIISLPLLFVLFYYFVRDQSGLPTNWPIVGMLPAVLMNVHNIHHFIVELMQKSQSLTFHFKGPWFSDMHFIITVDPANINHVVSRNFVNYNRGHKFNEIFQVIGNGIFNAESTLWQYHRRLSQSFFGHKNFHSISVTKMLDEIENKLIPVLDHFSMHGIDFDLENILKRFAYDNICTILMDYDPEFLSLHMPPIRLAEAVTYLEQVVLNRHIIPTFIWKSLKWLGVGEERYKDACETLDTFIYKCIAEKREKKMKSAHKEVGIEPIDEVTYFDDLLTLYMDNSEENSKNSIINNGDDVFLRDTFVSLFMAGGDTPSVSMCWLFYVFIKYPNVTAKIRDELDTMMAQSNVALHGLLRNFSEHKDKLVYLHAVICETLRLYPPTGFNHKASINPDILPSGHRVDTNMQIIFDMYAMGRMKLVWGDDCDEFKPERWITEQGNMKLEPSNKFMAFGAGPRICLGKDMTFTQMKLLVVAIIPKYDIEVVQGHHILPDHTSIVLQMKHGFKVKIKKYSKC